jgi:glycosyltransferase involved in cell wall biosynthesis
MKIPVIASKIGGLVELIQNNNTGLLLDKLNSDNITQAVIKLEQDSCLRENLIKNAEVFSRKFDGYE